MANKTTWNVQLERTDGVVCKWTFEKYTLKKVKDIIKGYVECCCYDCIWKIMGDNKIIEGTYKQK